MGIEIADSEKTGSFSVTSTAETYYPTGIFEPEHMLRARAKITSHFIHPGFRSALPDPQLQNPRNSSLFLWF